MPADQQQYYPLTIPQKGIWYTISTPTIAFAPICDLGAI